MSAVDDLLRVDRETTLHSFTRLKQYAAGEDGAPRIITGGEGIRVRVADGRELIDAFAGIYCVHVGYGRREIADAIHAGSAEARRTTTRSRGYSNEPAIRLAQRVLAMAPPGMQRIQFGLSGSDANETQLKIVWYYNNVLGGRRRRRSSRAGAAITAAP